MEKSVCGLLRKWQHTPYVHSQLTQTKDRSICDHQRESEVGSHPDNTETYDLLDEKSEELGFWHPDDGNLHKGKPQILVASTAKEEEWSDIESMITQDTALRIESTDVAEEATMRNLLQQERFRDNSASLIDSDTDQLDKTTAGIN